MEQRKGGFPGNLSISNIEALNSNPVKNVYWTVRVWGQQNKASPWSEAAWWEMAFLETKDWSANWINDGKKIPENEIDLYKNDPAPLFRKEFLLEKSITAAQLYITGLGYYEAYLNGERVGKSDLDPAWTVFSKRIFYSVTDVKAQLQKGGIVSVSHWEMDGTIPYLCGCGAG